MKIGVTKEIYPGERRVAEVLVLMRDRHLDVVPALQHVGRDDHVVIAPAASRERHQGTVRQPDAKPPDLAPGIAPVHDPPEAEDRKPHCY